MTIVVVCSFVFLSYDASRIYLIETLLISTLSATGSLVLSETTKGCLELAQKYLENTKATTTLGEKKIELQFVWRLQGCLGTAILHNLDKTRLLEFEKRMKEYDWMANTLKEEIKEIESGKKTTGS